MRMCSSKERTLPKKIASSAVAVTMVLPIAAATWAVVVIQSVNTLCDFKVAHETKARSLVSLVASGFECRMCEGGPTSNFVCAVCCIRQTNRQIRKCNIDIKHKGALALVHQNGTWKVPCYVMCGCMCIVHGHGHGHVPSASCILHATST